jgi:hypothetical protein
MTPRGGSGRVPNPLPGRPCHIDPYVPAGLWFASPVRGGQMRNRYGLRWSTGSRMGIDRDIRLWFMKSRHEIRSRLAERLEDLNGYPTEDRDERYEWLRGYAEALEWVLL